MTCNGNRLSKKAKNDPKNKSTVFVLLDITFILKCEYSSRTWLCIKIQRTVYLFTCVILSCIFFTSNYTLQLNKRDRDIYTQLNEARFSCY